MDIGKRITFSAVFTFIATLDGVIDLILKLLSNNLDKMNWHISIQLVSMLVIFSSCYYLIGEVNKLKIKYELGLLLSQVRDVIIYHERYGNEMPLRLPEETDEQYFNRTNASKYQQRLQNEMEELTKLANKKFDTIPPKEMNIMIKDLYNNHFNWNSDIVKKG